MYDSTLSDIDRTDGPGDGISVRRWRRAQDVISQRALGSVSKYWWHFEEQMDILGNMCISFPAES